MKMWSWVLVAVLAFASFESEAARRLGGGGSLGRQSGNVTQREAARPAQAPQQQQQATPATQPGANAAAQAPRRPWGAMLGGLAAGLGLAWLANSLGLGAGFANFLLILLLGMAILAVIAAVRRSRAGARPQGGYAYQGAGATAQSPVEPRQYSPDKVGNDASARPWERSSMAFEAPKAGAGSGVQIGSGLAGSQTWGIPAGFDTEGFLVAAKRNFVMLQDAWDRGDVGTLRSMMTDEMLGEIKSQLAQRERDNAGSGKTDVEMLDAKLLGIEDTGTDYLASVEFSGMIREEPSAGASSFREVWNMSKPKSGGGWLVAGVQALQ
ncbi:Tim44 domain-containing protein [Ramlibacter sp. RBP-2]|uniref:Tim44 domain-containing protein n=1 Tax=Ramlibacter lithotrophicus TaxID=2606681 RepID=A0A7X6DHK4_9BURK|nr:Tim44-like domain-containing protein [Ramlibacter lithotrophicus]NKE67275.1 Tim44 domain-containing protein [Ramlibacter lithotrophicus]